MVRNSYVHGPHEFGAMVSYCKKVDTDIILIQRHLAPVVYTTAAADSTGVLDYVCWPITRNSNKILGGQRPGFKHGVGPHGGRPGCRSLLEESGVVSVPV
jgi:hypothetical protein